MPMHGTRPLKNALVCWASRASRACFLVRDDHKQSSKMALVVSRWAKSVEAAATAAAERQSGWFESLHVLLVLMQLLYRQHFASATSLLPFPVWIAPSVNPAWPAAHTSQSDQRLLLLKPLWSRLISSPGTLLAHSNGGYLSPLRGVSIAWTGRVACLFRQCSCTAALARIRMAHGGRAPDAVESPNSLPERQGSSAIGRHLVRYPSGGRANVPQA